MSSLWLPSDFLHSGMAFLAARHLPGKVLAIRDGLPRYRSRLVKDRVAGREDWN
jgi:hypothetical protein